MRKWWSILFVGCAWTMGAAPASVLAGNDAIEGAMHRGITMFWYDRAAWVTSDDLVANLHAERRSEIGGWVVTPSSNGWHVDYFGRESMADSVIYEADVVGNSVTNRKIHPKGSLQKLPAPALKLAMALQSARVELAKHSDWGPCVRANFNTIVLPADNDGNISVYFLTPQTVTDSFPFGGHYKVVISSANAVVSARKFSNSCITLAKPRATAGKTPEAMFLTHLLDPSPTEIHVFEQFPIGMPLYVGIATPRSIWKVENGKITAAD